MSDLININSGVVQGTTTKTKTLLILRKPKSLEAPSQEPGTKIGPILYYTMAALRWEGGAPIGPCGVPTKLQVKPTMSLSRLLPHLGQRGGHREVRGHSHYTSLLKTFQWFRTNDNDTSLHYQPLPPVSHSVQLLPASAP